MKNAYTGFSTKKTPQSEPIFGEPQVKNNAGGYVYETSAEKAFERFLILGSEGGTYYVGEQKLTKKNAAGAMKFIAAEGRKAVEMIVQISDSGRAHKNDPAIFALALAASTKDPDTRAYALAQLPKVCRIPTHLFHFLEYVQQFRGFGRGLKTAIARWYNDKPVDNLAYSLVKYQSRDGWSNADALRLSHPKTTDVVRNNIYKWAVDGFQDIWHQGDAVPGVVGAFEVAKTADPKLLIKLIVDYNLSREMLPTEALNKPEVWEVLLEKMPITAMIRNLGNMSKVGLLTPLSSASGTVAARLRDEGLLKKGRVHPLSILLAARTYGSGQGMLGKGTWTVVPQIVEALDDSFYLAFRSIEPTGKRFLLGVDVSGSMSVKLGKLPISCCEGAAAMAMAVARVEHEYFIHGFTSGYGNRAYNFIAGGNSGLDGFVSLGIHAKMSLREATQAAQKNNFGATDCAVPMLWATKTKTPVDCFVVITDNETWAGNIHPKQALEEYRQTMGIASRQVVIGMTATNFTIADPNDPLTLDVAGFDASVPEVLQGFVKD